MEKEIYKPLNVNKREYKLWITTKMTAVLTALAIIFAILSYSLLNIGFALEKKAAAELPKIEGLAIILESIADKYAGEGDAEKADLFLDEVDKLN